MTQMGPGVPADVHPTPIDRERCIHEIWLRLLSRRRTIFHELWHHGTRGVSMTGYFSDATLPCAELPYSLEKAVTLLFFRKTRVF